jgi:phosphoglycerate kinase
MIKRLNELDLKGKRVFVRVDFNVPIHRGKISETHRIESVLPTLRFVIGKTETVVIASHLGRPGGKRDPASSLAPVRDFLEQALACSVALAPDCVGSEVEALVRGPQSKIILLENLRFHKEEEKNDPAFARALAALAEVYVNDAFGAAHRAHASTAGMAAHFQAKGAGLLMQKELDYLGKILAGSDRPFVTVLGGAKVSDKIALVEHLLDRVQALIVGGGMSFTFLKALGHGIGRSLVEPDHIETARRVLEQSRRRGVQIVLPVDTVVAENVDSASGRPVGVREIPDALMGLDIGPLTVERFIAVVRTARTLVWNGPMGVFEKAPFAAGTMAVGRAVAAAEGFSVIGGGDTVAAVHRAGVADRIGYISTAGGAFLEFLEGRKLPGVEALTEAP